MSIDRKNSVPLFLTIGIILCLVLVHLGVQLFKDTSPKSVESALPPSPVVKGERESASEQKLTSKVELSRTPPAETIPISSPSPVIDKEKILSDLNRYACTYQASSLPQIEPYLYSKDKDLREAALNDIVILGDAAGAPILRKAADQSQDTAEAAELLNKANYLELPSGSLLKK